MTNDNDKSTTSCSSEGITLCFSEDFGDFLLLDVSDEEIRRAVSTPGDQLKFKGKSDAVLCTSRSTFALFSRETSNDLFLLSEDVVRGCGAHRFIEPTRIKPRLFQLRALLLNSAMTADELLNLDGSADNKSQDDETLDNEEDGKKRQKLNRLTFEDILREVQASEVEIRQALNEMGAFETSDGFWQILSQELEEKVVSQLILEINAQGLDVQGPGFSSESMIQSLSEFPSFVVQSVCSRFIDEQSNMLNVEKLAGFLSECFLIKNPEIRLNDFKATLFDSMPNSTNKDLDIPKIVQRIALIDEEKGSICYLPLDLLPREPRKRCEILFAKREFWQVGELEIFLDGVDGGINETIQKFARVSTDAKGRRGLIRR